MVYIYTIYCAWLTKLQTLSLYTDVILAINDLQKRVAHLESSQQLHVASYPLPFHQRSNNLATISAKLLPPTTPRQLLSPEIPQQSTTPLQLLPPEEIASKYKKMTALSKIGRNSQGSPSLARKL